MNDRPDDAARSDHRDGPSPDTDSARNHPLESEQVKLLRATLAEAGVMLGPHDEMTVRQVGGWDLATVLVIASWINRARSGR